MYERGDRKESAPDVKAFYDGIVKAEKGYDDKFLYLVLGYMGGRNR
jgi:hypothetical protein